MAQIRDKWLSCVRISFNKWKIAEKCEKGLKDVGNDLDMWEMAEIYMKWLRYVVNGLTL